MLDAMTRTAFRVLSGLRGERIFHPQGVAFEARWDAADPALPIGSPLASSGHGAVVRLSRGVGLPTPVPDLLGVAIKVLDVHGGGKDQDLLLASVGSGPVGRRVLTPARDFRGTTFSSVLPYDVGDSRTPVVAEVHGAGPSTFPGLRDAVASGLVVQLFLASGGHFARVSLGRRVDDAVARELAFDPWHTGDALRPAGAINRLRRPAYRASQEGRRSPPPGPGASAARADRPGT